MNTHMQNEQNELEQNISELVAIKNEYIDDLSILYYDLDNAISEYEHDALNNNILSIKSYIDELDNQILYYQNMIDKIKS